MPVARTQVLPVNMTQPGGRTYPVQGGYFVDPNNSDQQAILYLTGTNYQSNPAFVMTWSIQRADDPGGPWVDMVSTTIEGGFVPRFPPTLKTTIDGLKGKYVRMVFDNNERERFGIDIEII